jgi:hypothetical protein
LFTEKKKDGERSVLHPFSFGESDTALSQRYLLPSVNLKIQKAEILEGIFNILDLDEFFEAPD